MTAGVIINGINTLDEYGLMMLAEYTITSPKRKRNLVSIPGMNGSLDLSPLDANGQPVFEEKEISFKLFKSVNDAELTAIRDVLLNKYHGRLVKVILPFDENYYYEGEIEIGEMSNYNSGVIPVFLTAFPYKFENASSLGDWLWDPFVFSRDIARDYYSLPVEGTAEYIIIGSNYPADPVFTVNITSGTNMRVLVDNLEYEFAEGEHTIPGLILGAREYVFTFFGYGSVTIQFRGGML